MPIWEQGKVPPLRQKPRRITGLSERRVELPPTPQKIRTDAAIEAAKRKRQQLIESDQRWMDSQIAERKAREQAEEKQTMDQQEKETRERALQAKRAADELMSSVDRAEIEAMLDRQDATYKERDQVTARLKQMMNPSLYDATVALQKIRDGETAPQPLPPTWQTTLMSGLK